jgi:hypothetical protein
VRLSSDAPRRHRASLLNHCHAVDFDRTDDTKAEGAACSQDIGCAKMPDTTTRKGLASKRDGGAEAMLAAVAASSLIAGTKQCFRCRRFKDRSEFHKFARNLDGLQPYCRDCKREIDNEHYRTHPRRNYERNKAKALANRRWLYEYLKTKQCEWEGCAVNDPDMLVLDHLNPAEKRREVSRMAHQTYSLKTIEEEVKKCRVLCANHHQKHTIQQFGYKKWVDEMPS